MAGWVLGCHRSGTSLIARILREASGINHRLAIGEDIPQALDNPGGHCESAALMHVNEQLLNLAGCTWHRPFLARPDWESPSSLSRLELFRPNLASHLRQDLWIDKDPRLCLTRDALAHIMLRDIPALAVVRHPFSVAQSLFLRDGFSFRKSVAIWITYNYHLYNGVSHHPSSTILFDDLFTSVPDGFSSVSQKLDSFLSQSMGGSYIQSVDTIYLLNRTLQPRNLRSHYDDAAINDPELADCVRKLWEHVVVDIRANNGVCLSTIFRDAFSELIHDLAPEIPPPLHGIETERLGLVNAQLHDHLGELGSKLSECDKRLASLQNSTSWRVTDPLRKIGDILKKLS